MAGKIIISNLSGGIPGGSDKQVQFNDAGVFGGGAQLFWDSTNNYLGAGTSSPTRPLHVLGASAVLKWSNTILLEDSRVQTVGVGGGLTFGGKYTDEGAITPGGFIRLEKQNSTSYHYGFDLSLGARINGEVPTELIRLHNNKVGIGTATPTTKLTVGEITEQNTCRINGVSTANMAPVLSLFRHAGAEWVAAVHGDKFLIGTDPASYTDANLSSSAKFAIDATGHIGIGTISPAISALLELSSTTGSLLLSRMTTTQKNALTPVNGMMVYDSTLSKFQGRENGSWISLVGGGSDFSNGGEAGGADRSLGNTDAFALSFLTNNLTRVKIVSNGRVSIGVPIAPVEILDINGAIRIGSAINANAGTIRYVTDFEGYNGASWVSLTKTIPEGLNTQIQYNNAGVFGGDADFCWTSTTNLLSLTNAQIQSKDNANGDFTLVSTPLVHAWTWDYRAANFIQNRQAQVLATNGSSHSFSAGLALHHIDSDTTNYQTSGTIHQMYGLECHMLGTTTSASYKDMVGVFSRVMNRTNWNLRGCSGFNTEVHQYGEGIASNEFHIFDPGAGAEGGYAQCKSSAGLQIVMHHHFADEDATHLSRGLMIDVFGKRITAGITMSSNVDGAFGSGYLKYAIDMTAADISSAAIRMPGSSAGNTGTFIEYDPNDYTWYDRTNNNFNWVAEGVTGLVVGGNMVNAVAIRVNSTLLYIERSADVDGAGKHYLVVT